MYLGFTPHLLGVFFKKQWVSQLRWHDKIRLIIQGFFLIIVYKLTLNFHDLKNVTKLYFVHVYINKI